MRLRPGAGNSQVPYRGGRTGLAIGVSRAFLRVGDEGSHQERLARMTDRERAIVAEFLAGCGVPR